MEATLDVVRLGEFVCEFQRSGVRLLGDWNIKSFHRHRQKLPPKSISTTSTIHNIPDAPTLHPPRGSYGPSLAQCPSLQQQPLGKFSTSPKYVEPHSYQITTSFPFQVSILGRHRRVIFLELIQLSSGESKEAQDQGLMQCFQHIHIYIEPQSYSPFPCSTPGCFHSVRTFLYSPASRSVLLYLSTTFRIRPQQSRTW